MTTPQAKDSAVVVTTATTSTANTPTDIEAQKQQQAASAAANSTPDNAGKGLGIACFVLLLIGFPFNFIQPVGTFVCNTVVIIITSTITCGCCCGSDLNLQPQVKKWSTATLVSLCLMFVVQIIGIIGASIAVGTEVSNTGTLSQKTADGAGVGMVIVWALSIVFNVFALIFAGLFTWGRNSCGAPRA